MIQFLICFIFLDGVGLIYFLLKFIEDRDIIRYKGMMTCSYRKKGYNSLQYLGRYCFYF